MKLDRTPAYSNLSPLIRPKEWFQCINKTVKLRRPSTKTTKSDLPVNVYTCKSFDNYDTDSCSDELEDEREGYLQRMILIPNRKLAHILQFIGPIQILLPEMSSRSPEQALQD